MSSYFPITLIIFKHPSLLFHFVPVKKMYTLQYSPSKLGMSFGITLEWCDGDMLWSTSSQNHAFMNL